MPSGRFLHPQHPFAQVSKFLDCNSAMSRSRQSLAGSRIADFTVVGYFHFETAGERAYLEHESYEQRRAESERRKDGACDTKARSNKCKMNGQMSVEAVSS